MIRNLRVGVAILIALALTLAAQPLFAEEPQSLHLSDNSLALKLGQIHSLTYTITPAGATDDGSWSVAPQDVVTVSDRGLVTAVGVGSATVVYMLAKSGISDSCLVTVTDSDVPITGDIAIDPPTALPYRDGAYLLDAGKSVTLRTNATGSWVGATTLWSSSNAKRATVQGGVVEALSGNTGYVEITMTAVNPKTGGTATDSLRFHVAPAAKSIKLGLNTYTLYVNGKAKGLRKAVKITATVRPADAHYESISWESSKPGHATVNQKGVVTAVEPGKTVITASTDTGASATCHIVVDKLPTFVRLPKRGVLEMGKKYNFNAKLEINGTDLGLKWRSSKPSVVSVSAKGILKARYIGNAKVSVKTINNLTATCKFRVVVKKDALEKDEVLFEEMAVD